MTAGLVRRRRPPRRLHVRLHGTEWPEEWREGRGRVLVGRADADDEVALMVAVLLHARGMSTHHPGWHFAVLVPPCEPGPER